MRYEAPRVVDYGSIAAHTFTTPPTTTPGRGGGGNKGFVNCRVEGENCELSHPGDGGLSP